MDMLTIGDPMLLGTDIGPLIDEPARAALEAHVARMQHEAKILHTLRAAAAEPSTAPSSRRGSSRSTGSTA